MSERVFAWSLTASLVTHLAGLAVASVLVRPGSQTLPPVLVPIELVTVAPTPPVPEPAPKKEAPRKVEKITPPRLVVREPQPLLPAPAPSLVEQPLSAPPVPMPLGIPREARRPLERPAMTLPAPGPLPMLPPLAATGIRGKPEAPTGGGEAGAGKLGSTGDFAVLAGPGAGGGSGAAGRSGLGAAATGGEGSAAGGPLAFARPHGGYQVKPPYPESARRQGIQGVTILKFEVLTNGRVGEIQVAQSAGHPDLDRAAIEAVRKWRFEPARRGTEPVAVWVTLPVRFELR